MEMIFHLIEKLKGIRKSYAWLDNDPYECPIDVTL